MKFSYTPRGVCSRQITFFLDDGVVTGVKFTDGCSGNSQGISRLVEGMTAEEAIRRLSGIHCGPRSTSCPDQLARALREALEKAAASRPSGAESPA